MAVCFYGSAIKGGEMPGLYVRHIRHGFSCWGWPFKFKGGVIGGNKE
jgi:hypothetical protein